jgi:PD-(D/E)XK nuclease superfamily
MIEHEGKKYARVSEILQSFNNFDQVDQEWLAYRASVGTQVHVAILNHLQDEFPVLNRDGMPYFTSFLEWQKTLSPQFIWMEKRFFNDDKMLTGCIDALVKMPGDKFPIIIDYKTGASESKTWVMQAHLYHFLASQENPRIGKRCLFLKLSTKGHLPIAIEYKIDKNITSKCMLAVENFWKNQNSVHKY